MTTFEFSGIDGEGRRRRGRIQADTREGAMAALRTSGVRVIDIHSTTTETVPFWQRDILGSDKPGRKDLLAFYLDAATLLGANLPVDRALRLSCQQARPRMRPFVQALYDGVVAGRALSEAMRAHPGVFPVAAIEMVKAGEMTGTLAGIFARLAETSRRQEELRSAITSALIYPALLIGLSFIIIIVVVSSLLPSIAPLFDAPGVVAPMPIRLMKAAERLVAEDWPFLLAAGFATALGAFLWWRNPKAQIWRNRMLRRAPLVGALLTDIDVGRTCRVLSALVAARVPLPRALAVVEGLPAGLHFRTVLADARRRIQEGTRLADALEPLRPSAPQMIDMIRTGEEVNRLDDMLLRLADLAEENVRTKSDRLLTLLTPVITCVMGLVIGGLIMMIMTSILSINDLAGAP
jgi:general secretion pathway protein F